MEEKDYYYPTEEFKKIAWSKDQALYKEGAGNPVKFWEKRSKELFWSKKWSKTFIHNPPHFEWFQGGKINITSNIFENNPLGFETIKNKVALIWEPEPTEEASRYITYYELFRQVNRFANALKKMGVKKGDVIGIYLPMIPEIIVAMLACARIGAVHNVVFSAFSAQALKVRLDYTGAKILITADGYFRRNKTVPLKESADQGIEGTKVEKVIVIKRMGREIPWNSQRDVWYGDLVKDEKDFCPAEDTNSSDLLFILPESGTAGQFLPIYHTMGGYTVQAYWTGKWVFNYRQDDIFWSTADMGWVSAHTYNCYSPLLNGVTFLIFEGAIDWPDSTRWAQVIQEHGITTFYTSPTAIRMFMKYGTEVLKPYDFSTLRLLGSVGEALNEEAWHWYYKEIGKDRCPIVDTWWQTETGGVMVSSLPGVGPFRPGFVGLPLPGMKTAILDEQGKECKTDEKGNLVLLPPYAPSLLTGIYNDDKKYIDTYWSKYGNKIYFPGDTAIKDKKGLIKITGRADDMIKISGHRLTTSEMERAVLKLSDFTETAVIGVPDPIKGDVPIVFAVSRSDRSESDLAQEIVDQIRKEIGAIASPKKVIISSDLPKTRSGKVMRLLLKNIFMGQDLGDLSNVSNPDIIKVIEEKSRS
ncbi:MAG: acetate--CoA ligase [Candidatus Paceibacterota bacterium]|jgi:acetyl-CoA synthetase